MLLFDCILFPFRNLNAVEDPPSSAPIEEKKIYFIIRTGQGGFNDNRSPIGKLGGGQLTLDIKPARFPIGISISGEYYTNSADPTHSYEIAGLTSVNLLFMTKLFRIDRANLFIGGGIGELEVPRGEDHPGAIGGAILYIQHSFEGEPRRYEYRGLAGADDAIALARKYAMEVEA